MIKRVYKTEEVTTINKVEKELPKEIEEVTYVNVPHTNRIYHGPSSSGKCLHCGVTLHDYMWKYQSKSDKYLCKHCWYSLSEYRREEYRRQAREEYYSTETYYTKEKKVTTKTILEKVIVEEKVTNKVTKLLNPIACEYSKKNKVYINEISIDDILVKHINFITNDKIKEESQWYGLKNLYEFKDFFLNPSNNKTNIKLFSLKDIPYNEYIIDEKQELQEFCDVVGFYPNVPAYIQGHPLNMYNNIRRNIVTVEKSITLYINLAIDSKFHYSIYINRGAILYALYNFLTNNDIKVNIVLLDATYINGETLIQKVFVPSSYIKENLDFIYNTITKIAFYRVIFSEHKYRFIQNNNLNKDWEYGFGFALPNDELKSILELTEEDILIGNPEEHGINGLYDEDDYANCMESLNLYNSDDDNIYKSVHKNSDLSLKQILEKRNIEKLIHVTSEKNIESIFKYGLLSVDKLEKDKIEFERNDYLRLDHHTDSICLSIQNPNEYLFNEFQRRNPNDKYIVLEIDPKILLDKNIKRLYFDYNAASRFSNSSDSDLEIMFKNNIRKRAKEKNRNNKKDNEPTSLQAEILFFGDIKPQNILNHYEYVRAKR